MGGFESVTIGDAAAKSNEGNKIKLQRRESAIFPVIVELSQEDRGLWTIYLDAEKSVDNILAKKACKRQKRYINFETGDIQIQEEELIL